MKNTKNVLKGGFFASFSIFILLAASYVTASAENYKKAVSKDILYNDMSVPSQSKKMPGMLSISAPNSQQEQAFLAGPQSFNSDDLGAVYICDTLNHAIQVYSPKGTFQKTFQIDPNMVAGDIVIDRSGDMYIYDDVDGRLCRYNRAGRFISEIKVDILRIDGGRGAMHMAGRNIYVPDSAQRDVMIGKVANGVLVQPSPEELKAPLTKGINAPSGRKYYVELNESGKGVLNILGSDGKTIVAADIPAPGLLSLSFIKEDKKSNSYVQAERRQVGKVLLEIYKFGPAGNHVSTTNFTDTEYHFWSVKLLSVDDNENIYQFVPSRKKGTLNIFKK